MVCISQNVQHEHFAFFKTQHECIEFFKMQSLHIAGFEKRKAFTLQVLKNAKRSHCVPLKTQSAHITHFEKCKMNTLRF